MKARGTSGTASDEPRDRPVRWACPLRGGNALPDVQILLFPATSAALIVHPGPNMLYVLTRAVGGGRKVGLVSVAGVGQLANTAAAALGLSALLAQSALAFSVVKWAGACYLIYLGVKTLLPRQTRPSGRSRRRDGRGRRNERASCPRSSGRGPSPASSTPSWPSSSSPTCRNSWTGRRGPSPRRLRPWGSSTLCWRSRSTAS